MDKSFTIIIPCFNTEKYISKAINSLINQNYNIELLQILIIDDGSYTNNIEKIIYKYRELYLNIEYFYKDNNHWGSVINYVLENKLAKNEYISILDSDDFLHKDCFQIINKKVKNNDVFIGSCKKWNGKHPTLYFSPYFFLFKRVITEKNQKQTPICLPMLFFYKKELFYSINKLEEKIPHQDSDFIAQILLNSKSVIFNYKIIGYYYSTREGNSMNQVWNDNRFNAEYLACNKFLNYDLQELIAFRLNVKEFRTCCLERNIKFIVKRRFKFYWLPFVFRIFYIIIFYLIQKKFFIFNK